MRPPKGDHAIKFKCFRCGEWGDEADLMMHLCPGEGWTQRRERLEKWRQDYEATVTIPQQSISHRGTGSTKRMNQQSTYRKDSPNPDLAWANVIDGLRTINISQTVGFQLLDLVVAECEACNVSVTDLHKDWQGFEEWKVDFLQRHAAECDDPECGDECLQARGLPPLSEEQRAELARPRIEAKRQQMERVRKAIKPMKSKR